VGGYYRLKDLGFRLAAGANVVPRAEFAAVADATQLVADAEAKAAEIIKAAEAAFAQEKLRGYEAGLAQAQVESVERLVSESQVLDSSLMVIERDLAKLVAAGVRKIIEDFDDQSRAEAVVRSALKQMRQEKRAQLRAPTGLYEQMRARIGVIVKEFPEVDLIDVVEDTTLEPTQVIIETSVGRVDGNLSHRLDELETVIRSAYSRVAVEPLETARAGQHTETT
jgi:type III secretion protein L